MCSVSNINHPLIRICVGLSTNAPTVVAVHLWAGRVRGVVSTITASAIPCAGALVRYMCQSTWSVRAAELAQFAIESETGSHYSLPEQMADTLWNTDDIGIKSPNGMRRRQLHFLACECDGRGTHYLGGANQTGKRGIHQCKPTVRVDLQHA